MAHVDPMERVISVVAFAATMVAVLALHFAPMKMLPEPPPPEPPQVMVSVTLEAAPPELPSPPAAVPPPPPPPPVKEIQPDRPIVPVQRREPPPKPRPPAPPKPEQTVAKPVETPAPALPAPVAPPVATPKPAAPPANTASEEAGYVGRLRGYIRSITQYPTSGQARRERPEGSTEVRFTLNRGGQLQDASIEQSSGSPILDRQALSIVKGGAYPAMPADAWADTSEHVFTVTVVFTAP